MIDKTKYIEKGVSRFPFVYIQGASGTGKTTALHMWMEKHPENTYVMNPTSLSLDIDSDTYIIFDPVRLDLDYTAFLSHSHIIFCGQEPLSLPFLTLLWRGKLGILSQSCWMFSLQETAQVVTGSLPYQKVYQYTYGWPALVCMLDQLSYLYPQYSCEQLFLCVEMKEFLKDCLFTSLSEVEKEVLMYALSLPWIEKDMFEMDGVIDSLTQKGLLYYDQHYRLIPFLRLYASSISFDCYEKMGMYYKGHGHIVEALYCFEKDLILFKELCIDCYKEIPWLNYDYKKVFEFDNKNPYIVYLKAMYAYQHQQDYEIYVHKLEKMPHADVNLLINLYYISYSVSNEQWMKYVEMLPDNHYSLYSVLGYSPSALCGLRDLSSFFACSKREENQNRKIWKEKFDKKTCQIFDLARIEYYYETNQLETLPETIFTSMSSNSLCYLYLLYKFKLKYDTIEMQDIIETLESELKQNFIAKSLCTYYTFDLEVMLFWLKNNTSTLSESNYYIHYLQAKGNILIKQYEKANKLLSQLIPYLRQYKRMYLLADCQFLQAIIHYEKSGSKTALKDMIETFGIGNNFRYIELYTQYGRASLDVLTMYIDWLKQNKFDGWTSKKKYNYGNVLRMPREDYLELLCRKAKKGQKNMAWNFETKQEALTMMESLVLQCVGKGMSNNQICAELHLKLPTVKGHISNIFKKLEVKNRNQAVLVAQKQGLIHL